MTAAARTYLTDAEFLARRICETPCLAREENERETAFTQLLQRAFHLCTHIVTYGNDAARILARADKERRLSARRELIGAREESGTDFDVLLLQPFLLSNADGRACNERLNAETFGLTRRRVPLEMEAALNSGIIERLRIRMYGFAFGTGSERQQRALRHPFGNQS